MKYLVLLLILIGFVGSAFAMPPFSSQEAYDFSNTIIVGKVIGVNSTFSPTHNLYEIQVEKFLKNPQDSQIILATGEKTIWPRLENQVFNTGDRALFFLTNSSVGYDVHSGILNVHPVSKKIEPVWDKCNVFEKDIPPEHWVFGGAGVLPKISQDEKLYTNAFQDRNNFKVGKIVTVSYDLSNISDNPKELELDGILSRSNGTEFEVMSTTSQHVVLEPCTVFKTIEWRFTPSMTGSYIFEINDDSGTSYGLYFTIKESVDSPLAQIKSGISTDEIKCKETLVLLQKYDGSPACVFPESIQKLVERGWIGNIIKIEPEIMNEIESASIAKYALDPEFEVQRDIAKEIFKSLRTGEDTPYISFGLSNDRKSLDLYFDKTVFTIEKNEAYYQEFIDESFAEITIPINVIFVEGKGSGDE